MKKLVSAWGVEIEVVKGIYREWEGRQPARHCVGLADCCRWRLTGRTPYVTRGEALVAARAWRAAGRTEVEDTEDGSCPFLKDGKCRIYEGRPFGCRTHFCAAAGGPASREEVRDLIQRLEEVDRKMGGEGGVRLPTAVRRVLKEGKGEGKKKRG